MRINKPISREHYLSDLYYHELEYINKIMIFQDFHFKHNGEIVVLVDKDFPNFKSLNEKKIEEIISIYTTNGWKIRKQDIKERKECLLIFS